MNKAAETFKGAYTTSHVKFYTITYTFGNDDEEDIPSGGGPIGVVNLGHGCVAVDMTANDGSKPFGEVRYFRSHDEALRHVFHRLTSFDQMLPMVALGLMKAMLAAFIRLDVLALPKNKHSLEMYNMNGTSVYGPDLDVKHFDKFKQAKELIEEQIGKIEHVLSKSGMLTGGGNRKKKSSGAAKPSPSSTPASAKPRTPKRAAAR